MTKASLLYLASLGAHGALAVGVISLKGTRPSEDVTIAVVENAKPKETPPPSPPPAVKDDAPKPEVKAKAAPKQAAAKAEVAPPPETLAAPTSAAASDAPDFGLSLSGVGVGGGGLAVPTGGARPARSTAQAPVAKKVLAAAPPRSADECAESATKPRVVGITQPAYTREAREANVAGKVRIEVTVDASGKVSGVRVLEGLGYGLDEAALAAARGATFEAATRCGKATSATFTMAIRFSL